MKIVNLETFLSLPEYTIYSQVVEGGFDGFRVKMETYFYGEESRDFYLIDLIDIEAHDSETRWLRLVEMDEKGASYPMNISLITDKSFNDKAQFLIYEKGDLCMIRDIVEDSLNTD